MRQCGIKKAVGRGKGPDDAVQSRRCAVGPGRMLGADVMILIIKDINLCPIVPTPALITGESQSSGNIVVLLLRRLGHLLNKGQRGVLIIDQKMGIMKFFPRLLAPSESCVEKNPY